MANQIGFSDLIFPSDNISLFQLSNTAYYMGIKVIRMSYSDTVGLTQLVWVSWLLVEILVLMCECVCDLGLEVMILSFSMTPKPHAKLVMHVHVERFPTQFKWKYSRRLDSTETLECRSRVTFFTYLMTCRAPNRSHSFMFDLIGCQPVLIENVLLHLDRIELMC
mgnify:CR=1 FL=1